MTGLPCVRSQALRIARHTHKLTARARLSHPCTVRVCDGRAPSPAGGTELYDRAVRPPQAAAPSYTRCALAVGRSFGLLPMADFDAVSERFGEGHSGQSSSCSNSQATIWSGLVVVPAAPSQRARAAAARRRTMASNVVLAMYMSDGLCWSRILSYCSRVKLALPTYDVTSFDYLSGPC